MLSVDVRLWEKEPRGFTTDTAGNIYICYNMTSEVAVLSKDFSEEKILLTQRGSIRGSPLAIAYDAGHHRLLVGYYGCNDADFFSVTVMMTYNYCSLKEKKLQACAGCQDLLLTIYILIHYMTG